MYYNAQHYDPALGAFFSSDTSAPNAACAVDCDGRTFGSLKPLAIRDAP
ncbi:MAG: hypothetical protein OXL39_14840 [Caldilineaceae bacterium]|nr:hypothetical protein [Caldilineaceae bacterium]